MTITSFRQDGTIERCEEFSCPQLLAVPNAEPGECAAIYTIVVSKDEFGIPTPRGGRIEIESEATS